MNDLELHWLERLLQMSDSRKVEELHQEVLDKVPEVAEEVVVVNVGF